VTVRLPAEVWRRVRVLAAARDTDGSSLIREWVEAMLKIQEEERGG
jgi:predicted transcriptional regulator